MKYEEVIDNLFLQAPSFQVVGEKAYHPGLDPMIRFADVLGNPQSDFKTIHIAGTNGKGSVSHILGSILASMGLKVGIYSSPHLLDFRERIKVVDSSYRLIGKDEVLLFLEKCDEFIKSEKPSFFEITTAMGFWYFSKEKVDVAIIETGLGGRLDSTNIIKPLLSVITSIGLDHTNFLGDTIEKISGEKAGIIKERTPVVIGSLPQIAENVIRERAGKSNSPIYLSEKENSGIGILCHTFIDSVLERMDLKGEYQKQNLKTVLASLEALSLSWSANFENTPPPSLASAEFLKNIEEAIINTAKKTIFRGRWEVISETPYIVCDIAHNEEGLRSTMRQLSQMYENRRFERLILIFGIMKDKEVGADLLPKAGYYYYTRAKGERALASEELKQRFRFEGEATRSVREAIERYWEQRREGDLVYIGGSSFVVAEALEYFEK